MPPKFQSSFIPKATTPTPSMGVPLSRSRGQRDILSLLASAIFTLSVLLSLGVFLYKVFLNYRIDQMGQELESARATLQPETVNELVRLDARITSTESLLDKHKVLSPIFDFLEVATPRTVRYTEFNYAATNKGFELSLKGEARGYGALAAAAENFNKSLYFKNVAFSDLRLDEKGNVVFTLSTLVDPTLISYARLIQVSKPLTAPQAFVAPTATTTATTTAKTATSTKATTTKKN